MSSSRNSHWCYSCQRPIRVRGGRVAVCPYCSEGFIVELNNMESSQDFFHPDRFSTSDRRFGIMEAFADYMRQRSAVENNHNYDIRGRPVPVQEHSPGFGPPMFVFGGQIPSRMPEPGGLEVLFNGAPGIGFTRGNVANYFMGPGLEELVEQLMGSGRRGPPPASRSLIDAMPTINITRRHLGSDPHCPICQEKFELGSEVRQMPCNHIYHSDCIVPWLVQHNSCPVCRHELLPTPGLPGSWHGVRSSVMGTQSRSGGERGRNRESDQGRRNLLSFLWPFHSSGSAHQRNETSSGSDSGGGHQNYHHYDEDYDD